MYATLSRSFGACAHEEGASTSMCDNAQDVVPCVVRGIA